MSCVVATGFCCDTTVRFMLLCVYKGAIDFCERAILSCRIVYLVLELVMSLMQILIWLCSFGSVVL